MSTIKAGYAKAEDGVNLYYEHILGPEDAPTIILCNGILCTTNYWHYLKDHFTGRYPVLSWDYRGHGKSDIPHDFESLSIPQLARDLAVLMDTVGIEKGVLIGFSMGVQTVVEFFRQFPDRVLGLVLLSGAVHKPFNLKVGTDKVEPIFRAFFNTASRLAPILELPLNIFLKSPLRMPVARRVGIDKHRAQKKDMIPYFEHIASMNKSLGFKSLRLMNEHSAMDILDKINVPTLIIIGENDGMTPPQHALDIHSKIKGSELFMVPFGQHTALIENPHAVNCRIELFLRDHFNYVCPIQAGQENYLTSHAE